MSETSLATEPQTQPPVIPPAKAPSREIRVVTDESSLSYLFDTARFEHMFRIATAMAAAALIPEHLRGIRKSGNFTPFEPEEIKANCFLVVNQSLRWGMDPFAVAPETYVVGGKLAYQGKLVAAVINSRAGLQGRLSYSFSGEKGKDSFTITVSGTFPGDATPREITLSVGEAKTENQMWRKDPEQKLVYSGVVKWARRYCPEVVLGIVTDDDIDRINEHAPRVVSHEVSKEPLDPFKDSAPQSTSEVVEATLVEEEPATASPQQRLAQACVDSGIAEKAFMVAIGKKSKMISELSAEEAQDAIGRFGEIAEKLEAAQ